MMVCSNGVATKSATLVSINALNYRSSMEYFVVIGVFCFLYSLGVLVYYIIFEEDQTTSSAPPSKFSPPVIVSLQNIFFLAPSLNSYGRWRQSCGIYTLPCAGITEEVAKCLWSWWPLDSMVQALCTLILDNSQNSWNLDQNFWEVWKTDGRILEQELYYLEFPKNS